MPSIEHEPPNPQLLGQPPPDALVEARLQLHGAAQVVASVGYTFVAPEPDYSHLSLSWHGGLGALVGQPASASPRFRAALRLTDLTLLLLNEAGSVHRRYPLAGRTLDYGYAWLASAIDGLTGGTTPLVRPDHELPDHPVAGGAAFTRDDDAFAEVARWYDHANRILQPVSASASEASPVRCWPHHFDIATLFQYDPGMDPEEARSIGVGLSPGDGSYGEPYWYLVPWPPPDPPAWPPLGSAGGWHTEGWRGAVLPGSQVVTAGDAEAQDRRVRQFIDAGIAASRSLLGLSE